MNAGKFRKVIKEFNLKEAIDEIVSIQKDKANLMGITLESHFINQLHSDSKISLFNKHQNNHI